MAKKGVQKTPPKKPIFGHFGPPKKGVPKKGRFQLLSGTLRGQKRVKMVIFGGSPKGISSISLRKRHFGKFDKAFGGIFSILAIFHFRGVPVRKTPFLAIFGYFWPIFQTPIFNPFFDLFFDLFLDLFLDLILDPFFKHFLKVFKKWYFRRFLIFFDKNREFLVKLSKMVKI